MFGNCVQLDILVLVLCNIVIVAFQDNIFVYVVAVDPYRALVDKASDAFYKLTNTSSKSRPTFLW